MNKPGRFLRMKTPADLLAVNYFASSGQLKGRFVQETEPPWSIWWEVAVDQGFIGRLGSMIQGQIEAPESVWEAGTPGSELKAMAWLDLFRKAVIKPEETRKVADEVILMTADREVFFAAIKNHFILQQGQFEFAVFDARREYFMLKISHPSLWVFNTLEQSGFTWFNLIEGHSGIYVEAGWRIHDISGPACFNQFKIMDGGVLLVQKDGRLLNLKPSWKKGESIIKVDFGEVKIPQKDQSEGLVIRPGLRKTDRRQLELMWKIEDRSRLKAIIANESLKSFRNYRCWACSDGRIFIIARDAQADRALASVLTDAFASFCEIEERVMVPAGYLLAPKLSSERLHKMFSAHIADYICFETGPTDLESILLRSEDMINIEDFITLEIESAVEQAKMRKPGWQFEFKELKKKKQLIEVEVKTQAVQKLEAASEDGQVGNVKAGIVADKKRRQSAFNLDNVPQIGDSEIAQLRLQVEAIDRQLNSNATNAELWRQRAEATRRMRMHLSTLASAMNAAAITGDTPMLVDCASEFCRKFPELSPLFAGQISEIEKGRLLAAIRADTICAEFHYVLLLVYAGRFNDRDIYNQAVAGMKSGFAAEKKQFYGFNETRVAGGGGMNLENRVELLTLKDYSRIEMNVRKFLLQVGCCSSMHAIGLCKLQLHKLLSVNLDEAAARKLVGPVNLSAASYGGSYPWNSSHVPPVDSGHTGFFEQMIAGWPESAAAEGLEPAISRWVKLLTMSKIRETPLRDFFTGELYKPPFMFYRSEETALKNGMIKNIAWMAGLSQGDFPEVSDGKPIARAIYARFGNGQSDWGEYLKLALKSGDMVALAKAQRLLLLMVSEYGPHPDFARFIAPAHIDSDHKQGCDIYSLTMYCDMFRLSLSYRRPVDEQRLFNLLINRIPQPPGGWDDFRDSAEWIILCLLLTSSPVRRFQLDNLTARAMRWLAEAIRSGDQTILAETLTVLSFLGIGTLADLVPEKLEFHQLLEKRRVFWIQHAFVMASRGDQAYKEWLNACNV